MRYCDDDDVQMSLLAYIVDDFMSNSLERRTVEVITPASGYLEWFCASFFCSCNLYFLLKVAIKQARKTETKSPHFCDWNT